MKMQDIIAIAKKWAIPYRVGLTKADLIWSIQEKEGNTTCFRRDNDCLGQGCLWQDDCIAGQ